MKEYVLKILKGACGDDLERATRAFENLSEKDLDVEYGYSGKTCRQVLKEYQDDRDKMKKAIAWVESK